MHKSVRRNGSAPRLGTPMRVAALFGPMREAQDVAGKIPTKEKGPYVGRKRV
jgi:hypothetical protein